MKYARYLWQAMRGFRTSIAIRILAGTGRVALGLLMVWLSKRFIDETIRTGSRDDIARTMAFLVLTMVGTIVLRLVYYYMTASAMVKKSNAHRLVGAFLLMRWFDARLAWALLLLTHIVIVVGKLIARRLRKMTLEIRNKLRRYLHSACSLAESSSHQFLHIDVLNSSLTLILPSAGFSLSPS